MTKGRILVVDAEASVREALRKVLEVDGYEVVEAVSRRVAVDASTRARPDVVVAAAVLPDGSALDLLSELRAGDPSIPCIVLARYEELDTAVAAIQAGAEQFLTKPVQLAALLLVVDRVLENQRNRRRRLSDETRISRGRLDPFRGESAAMRSLAEQARRVAGSSLPVLIHGETGTGKGVLASWIHEHGPRARECFLDLNCAGLSPEFLESELFGHEKGAFTGAVATKLGLLEVAHRGSLFLDEIGDVPLPVQPKLLKVLEEKRFRRLGDVREREVDIRLIAASHANLRALLERSLFRADLYFRIATVVLEIPPLRERAADIPALAETFLAAIASELPRDPVRLSDDARDRLLEYAWPGNIRELKNVLERAALLARSSEIRADELGFDTGPSAARRPTADGDGGGLALADAEREAIRKALAAERGRVNRAAASLGISRSALYEKIRRYRIVVPRG
jgi:DNA-binding NtrC family response regulator